MKNRFNRLTSKEWLPFQKSWFKFRNLDGLYEENIRFFCKAENEGDVIYYYGNQQDIINDIAAKNNETVVHRHTENISVQFAIFDLLDKITENTSIAHYNQIKKEVVENIKLLYNRLLHRRFITVFVRNIEINGQYFPFAWDLAKELSSMLSLKDEKIGCIETDEINANRDYFTTDKHTFYVLYFRKDENSDGLYKKQQLDFFNNIVQKKNAGFFQQPMKSWFILKPQPRKKDEILHPAKYPEDLVDIFIHQFTIAGNNVFDPMSGTGSTQIGALRNERNGYGTELSHFFTEIATNRCENLIKSLKQTVEYNILNIDARQANKALLPVMDYILTSPPYWDMLNMKGAENQAARKEKGLQTNYSDNEKDLGNISDYELFINELLDAYEHVIDLLKPGGYITIIVKNIKKKGKNYPFAWDLTEQLQKKLILLPAAFWCQDDLSIAPYGYGNTWVSNTFHHYCLNFQKPF